MRLSLISMFILLSAVLRQAHGTVYGKRDQAG